MNSLLRPSLASMTRRALAAGAMLLGFSATLGWASAAYEDGIVSKWEMNRVHAKASWARELRAATAHPKVVDLIGEFAEWVPPTELPDLAAEIDQRAGFVTYTQLRGSAGAARIYFSSSCLPDGTWVTGKLAVLPVTTAQVNASPDFGRRGSGFTCGFTPGLLPSWL